MKNPVASKSAQSLAQAKNSRLYLQSQPSLKGLPPPIAALIRYYKEEFSGPLPPPKILLKYEQACPGAANRIIKMAESQSSHRQNLETRVIESNIVNERTGMNYSFILTSALMIAGIVLLVLNKPVGYLSLFGPSIFHAGNYIYRKYVEKKEPKKREEEVKEAKKNKSTQRR